MNGYWADYAFLHPHKGRKTGLDLYGRPFTEMEKILLDRLPSTLAYQERFEIFRRTLQQHVRNAIVMASIPCGLMRDLLSLDYSGIADVCLIGIDLDEASIRQAKELVLSLGFVNRVEFRIQDAWQLGLTEVFSVISSNGLAIYEPSDERVIDLFSRFWAALKPDGVLVTSFLTPPPPMGDVCKWDMSKIDPQALVLQRVLFTDILNVKWQCFRTEEETLSQLNRAGFKTYDVIYDSARIYPTVVASK
jgi:SAM-dependent methyltransferase